MPIFNNDQGVLSVVQMFRASLAHIHENMAWPRYKKTSITLTVDYSGDEAKFDLKFSSGWDGETVKAASLVALMTEVQRRLNFADKQAPLMNLLALTDQSEDA